MNTLKTVIIKHRPINLFFTELIIALLFFSISGAVILQVFAAADKKARLSAEKESAMICAQSIAEVYSESGNAEKAIEIVFSEHLQPDEISGKYVLRLDEHCKPAIDGKINVEISETRETTLSGELSRISISFSTVEGELYSLDCSAYIPSGGDENA